MGAAERQARARAKREAAGLVQVNLWIPAHAVADFQRAAELIKLDQKLTVARLVDRNTGKLRGMK